MSRFTGAVVSASSGQYTDKRQRRGGGGRGSCPENRYKSRQKHETFYSAVCGDPEMPLQKTSTLQISCV